MFKQSFMLYFNKNSISLLPLIWHWFLFNVDVIYDIKELTLIKHFVFNALELLCVYINTHSY